MTNPPPLPKISFRHLYRQFRKKVIAHFLITILRTAWSIVLSTPIINLFQKEQAPSDYTPLLIPGKIRQWSLFRGIQISQGQFIVIGLLLVVGYTVVYYWDYIWEEELRIRGENHIENQVLHKFRHLSFETQQAKKDQVNKLVEDDSWQIGQYWEHIPNHIFHSVLTIVGTLYFHWGSFEKMPAQSIWFSLFWLGLINLVVRLFARKILSNEKKYKKKLDQEWAVINKERSNISLIEKMGLTSQHQTRQQKITAENEKLALDFSRLKSWSKTIPNNLLIDFYVFLLLFLSGDNFNGKALWVFWTVFNNFEGIFQCLWDYTDYAASRSRINTFLTLPERNDNLGGVELSPQLPVKSVRFEKVSFQYAGQKEWIISDYSHTFSAGKLNHLRGKNGTGKSTKLYLLLGVVRPQKGKIVIELENKQTYELHSDLNLAAWRMNNAVYCAHETLVEKGSTGQKQLTSLEQVFRERETSQIFCFDEADNALDVKNQADFQAKLQELIKKGKIVIYIKH